MITSIVCTKLAESLQSVQAGYKEGFTSKYTNNKNEKCHRRRRSNITVFVVRPK